MNITEVRMELEAYAAELAPMRMDDEASELAEALLAEVEELGGPDDPDWLMHFDERIHRFIWEAAGNPYLVETLERYFTHSLRIWYLVLDRVPGLATRCTTRPTCSRRCSPATAAARARSCASTCWRFSARSWPPSAAT